MDDTNPDWVPSQHLGYRNGAGPGVKATARYERAQDRQAKKAVPQPCAGTQPAKDDPLSPEISVVSENFDQETFAEGSSETFLVKEAAVQTVLTMDYISTLEEDRKRLALELRVAEEAKKKLEVTEASLRDDPAKVAFYTGLSSFARLLAVFQLVECVVKHTQQNGLAKFQEFVVFLMKLRCNFPLQDLDYRFGVSDSAFSRIFDKWLNATFWRLRSQIFWPSRNAIQKTMPQAFLDSFGSKVAVIIDCFEVKIERPSSMEPRSETWSQYKSSNTAKYLIGISPQGVITFISEGWGGRCSDKHTTENCGVLDMLTQGDVVLADRGFDIADTLGLYSVQLHVPAFTKGRSQLTALEVHNTTKLASVRIHVERVIGLVRNKFVIMKAVQPINFVACRQDDPVPPLDKTVTVCCALCNICPSAVPPNQKEPV